jgi:hypothetical protein
MSRIDVSEYYGLMSERLVSSIVDFDNCYEVEGGDDEGTVCRFHQASEDLLDWSLMFDDEEPLFNVVFDKICMACGTWFPSAMITQKKCLGCYSKVFRE